MSNPTVSFTCEFCGGAFESKRVAARFCPGGKCRKGFLDRKRGERVFVDRHQVDPNCSKCGKQFRKQFRGQAQCMPVCGFLAIPSEMDQPLCAPPSDAERAADRKELSKLSRANRFRLMFGQPLFPEN